jgi:hypothetical protein
MSKRFEYLIALTFAAIALPVFAASRDVVARPSAGTASQAGRFMAVPLKSWPVDTQSFIAEHAKSTAGANLKAASDRATVYRPVAVCRLVDTRGFPAAISITGPLAADSTTNVNAAGLCGIPSTGVAGISISFHVRNATVNNGGFIAFLQQGAPIAGVNAVFNPGAIWTATTANISLPDDSGNFEIYIAQSSVDVIVDVNGYYQDLDNVDIGTQELDIVGNVAAPDGDAFEVSNLGAGGALAASNFGGGSAFRINSGSFAVSGAGIGSGTTAFILEVNTTPFGAGGNLCGGQPSFVVIDHPMLNGDPNALVLVTPRERTPTSLGTLAPNGSPGPIAAVYLAAGSCSPDAANHWAIRDKTGSSLVNLSQFSVFIIKSQ